MGEDERLAPSLLCRAHLRWRGRNGGGGNVTFFLFKRKFVEDEAVSQLPFKKAREFFLLMEIIEKN